MIFPLYKILVGVNWGVRSSQGRNETSPSRAQIEKWPVPSGVSMVTASPWPPPSNIPRHIDSKHQEHTVIPGPIVRLGLTTLVLIAQIDRLARLSYATIVFI